MEKEWSQKYYIAPFFQWTSLVLFFPLLLWVAGYCLGELSILNHFKIPTFLRRRWLHLLLIAVSTIYVLFCLPYVVDILLLNLSITSSRILLDTIFVYAHQMIWVWMFYRYCYLIFMVVGILVSVSRIREEK